MSSMGIVATCDRVLAKQSGVMMDVDYFLLHLVDLLLDVPKCEYDDAITDLGNIVAKLLPPPWPTHLRHNSDAQAMNCKGLAFQRCMLDEVVGKAFKSHNALDREILCDRLALGYCSLKDAHHRTISRRRSARQIANTQFLMELYYPQTEDQLVRPNCLMVRSLPVARSPKVHSPVSRMLHPTHSHSNSPRSVCSASSINSPPRNLDRNMSALMCTGLASFF